MPPSRKDRYLLNIPAVSIESEENDLTRRSKFNFSYFLGIPPGQEFSQWTQGNLASLFEKLREYSREPLLEWTKRPAGKSGSILSIYGDFPRNSNFSLPKHVPHQAQWARFRLDWSSRLIGFTLPREFDGICHPIGHRYDCNTFYVVFLDENHDFYKSERK